MRFEEEYQYCNLISVAIWRQTGKKLRDPNGELDSTGNAKLLINPVNVSIYGVSCAPDLATNHFLLLPLHKQAQDFGLAGG